MQALSKLVHANVHRKVAPFTTQAKSQAASRHLINRLRGITHCGVGILQGTGVSFGDPTEMGDCALSLVKYTNLVAAEVIACRESNSPAVFIEIEFKEVNCVRAMCSALMLLNCAVRSELPQQLIQARKTKQAGLTASVAVLALSLLVLKSSNVSLPQLPEIALSYAALALAIIVMLGTAITAREISRDCLIIELHKGRIYIQGSLTPRNGESISNAAIEVGISSLCTGSVLQSTTYTQTSAIWQPAEYV